jgi:hypothetical protein
MAGNRNASTLKLVAALAIGLGLGAWAMRVYFDRTLRTWSPSERFVLRLGADLDLSAEQRERVGLILAEQKGRMEVRRQGWRQEVRVLAREGEEQIAHLLTAEQARRFAKLQDEVHGRFDRFLWTSEDSPSAIADGGPR